MNEAEILEMERYDQGSQAPQRNREQPENSKNK